MDVLKDVVRHVAMAKMVPFSIVYNSDSLGTSLRSTQEVGSREIWTSGLLPSHQLDVHPVGRLRPRLGGAVVETRH